MADFVITLGSVAGSLQIAKSELDQRQELFHREVSRLRALGDIPAGAYVDTTTGQGTPAASGTGSGIFQTIMGFLGDGFGALGSVVGFPLNLIGQGAGFVITTIADLAKNVPLVGTLISDILLAGNTLLQAGLSLPGGTLDLLGTLIKSFAKLPEDKQKVLQDASKEKFISKAAETGQQGDMQKLFNKSAAEGGEMGTLSVVKKAAGIAVPLAAGTVAFLVLQEMLGVAGSLGTSALVTALAGFGAYELGLFD